MKKFVFFLLLMVLCFSGFTQNARQFTLGFHGGGVFGLHNAGSYTYNAYYDRKLPQINPMFGVYGAYTLFRGFSLQAELDGMIYQRMEWVQNRSTEETRTWTYSSIDIPILVRYAFTFERAFIGIFSGLHWSIPVGGIKKIDSEGKNDDDYKTSGITWGATTGFFAGGRVGPGRLFAELRVFGDFNPLWAWVNDYEEAIIYRLAPVIMLGYEFSF